jgi:hypothetical protein
VKPLLKKSIDNRLKSHNFDQLLDDFEEEVKDANGRSECKKKKL